MGLYGGFVGGKLIGSPEVQYRPVKRKSIKQSGNHVIVQRVLTGTDCATHIDPQRGGQTDVRL